MAKFVISDHHFGHENIIQYCDRPFEDVQEMNRVMKSAWNHVVGTDDVVYHIGDLVFHNHMDVSNLYDELNGQIIVVLGNHDEIEEAPFPVVESFSVQWGKYRFYSTHRPENAPESADWILCGHHHNNHPHKYPLINKQTNTLNVSVEWLNYTPLKVQTLIELLDETDNKLQSYQRHSPDLSQI